MRLHQKAHFQGHELRGEENEIFHHGNTDKVHRLAQKGVHVQKCTLCQQSEHDFENDDSVAENGFARCSWNQSETGCQHYFEHVNHILLAEFGDRWKCETVVLYEWNAVAHNALKGFAALYGMIRDTLPNIESEIHAIKNRKGSIRTYAKIFKHGHPIVSQKHVLRWHDLNATREQIRVDFALHVVTHIQLPVQVAKSLCVYWMHSHEIRRWPPRPLHGEMF